MLTFLEAVLSEKEQRESAKSIFRNMYWNFVQRMDIGACYEDPVFMLNQVKDFIECENPKDIEEVNSFIDGLMKVRKDLKNIEVVTNEDGSKDIEWKK